MKRLNLFSRILCPLMAALCLAFIFSNSFEKKTAVKNTVTKIQSEATQVVQKAANNIKNEKADSSKVSYFVAKSGHAGEFLIFAVFLTLSYRFNFKKVRPFIFQILFIGLLCGTIDEFIQSYSSGRTSAIIDVYYDFIGILIGVMITWLITNIIDKKRKNSEY